MQMTPIQCVMARVGLRWTVRDLAERSGVTKNTVSRFETGNDATSTTIRRLQTALEAGGATFAGDPIQGDGVFIRPRTPD